MKIFSEVLSYTLPVFYLTVIYIYYIIFAKQKKHLKSKTTFALSTLVVLHFIELLTRHIALNTIPLSTVHDAFSFIAFSLIVIYLFIELSIRNKSTGLYILSFAFILELASTFYISWEPETNSLLTDKNFAIHASLSIMGYSALSLSAIFAFLYVRQDNNLKKKKLTNSLHLPALTYLENMSMRSVLIGIILLGLGIFHGHLHANNILGTFWPEDIKVYYSDMILMVYLLAYIVSRVMNWRGKWMAYLSLTGFSVLIIVGLIMVILADSFHRFL